MRRFSVISIVATLLISMAVGVTATAFADPQVDDVAGSPSKLELGNSPGEPKPPSIPVATDGVLTPASWVGPYTFRNYNSGKCLDILGASQSDTAKAVQYTCVAGGRSQMWLMDHVIPDAFWAGYRIGNVHSGKCLTSGFPRGSAVYQTTCVESDYQIWMRHVDRPNIYRNYVTGFCMEVAGAGTANFAPILSWDCHHQAHQVWLRYAP